MDVEITDPDVFVSQVQGPNSMKILEAASDNGMPDPFAILPSLASAWRAGSCYNTHRVHQ